MSKPIQWAYGSFDKAIDALREDLAKASANRDIGGFGADFIEDGQRWRLSMRRDRHPETPDLGTLCSSPGCGHPYGLHYWTHHNGIEGCAGEPLYAPCDCRQFEGEGERQPW